MGADPKAPLADLPKVGEVMAHRYRIDRLLGLGGMGAVFEASHLHLGEKVAIKFLLSEHCKDAEQVTRFTREAWAAAKIKNDHVARVTDVGSLENGTPYLVMEYLDGHELSKELTDGPLTVQDAVHYVLQAMEALAEAHKVGIVHRDLKPGNLFVTRRADDTVWIKVLDFGISKISTGAGSITKTSTLMGSPLYMAPEQLQSSKNVDARADIWALGVILYELLSGNMPFEGETLPQICTAVLHGQPRRLQESMPNVPAELEMVLLRCFAKDPKDRYPTLAELATALAPFGGPEAQRSATFVSRVMQGAPRPPAPSLPPTTSGDRITPTVALEPTLLRQPLTDPTLPKAAPVIAPPPERPVMVSSPGVTTGSPLSRTVTLSDPRPTTVVAFGAGLVVLVAVCAVVMLALSGDEPLSASPAFPSDVPIIDEEDPEPAKPPAPTTSASSMPAPAPKTPFRRAPRTDPFDKMLEKGR